MAEVTSGGLPIWYTITGDGPPVLWHTGGCGDSTMWQTAGYIEALPGYRHVLLDHRGHGRSGAPADLAGHGMDRYVQDVIAVLRDASIDRVVVVGYSLGARVGYAVAAAHLPRLAGIIGIDSIPNPASKPEELRRSAANVQAKGVRAVLAEMAGHESQPPPDWLLEHLSQTDALAFAGAYEAFATAAPFWPDVARLDVPTLFLQGVSEGEDDWRELGEAAVAAMPAARAVVLSGLGHLQAFWRTDMTLPPIEQFLAGIEQDAGSWRQPSGAAPGLG